MTIKVGSMQAAVLELGRGGVDNDTPPRVGLDILNDFRKRPSVVDEGNEGLIARTASGPRYQQPGADGRENQTKCRLRSPPHSCPLLIQLLRRQDRLPQVPQRLGIPAQQGALVH